VRNRWLTLAAAVAAALSGLFVALGAPMPVLAGSGSPQAGPFAVGNLLSYANSDFEGQANLIAVTNIGTISDSSVTALHGRGVPPSFRTADPLGSSLERTGSVARENQELFA
jgi:hypothetical protein